ncbi:hypothetical protein ACHAWF_009833, partial [Thalassiosira exigua]
EGSRRRGLRGRLDRRGGAATGGDDDVRRRRGEEAAAADDDRGRGLRGDRRRRRIRVRGGSGRPGLRPGRPRRRRGRRPPPPRRRRAGGGRAAPDRVLREHTAALLGRRGVRRLLGSDETTIVVQILEIGGIHRPRGRRRERRRERCSAAEQPMDRGGQRVEVQLDRQRHADNTPQPHRVGEHVGVEERRERRVRASGGDRRFDGRFDAHDAAVRVPDAAGVREPLPTVDEGAEVHGGGIADDHARGLSGRRDGGRLGRLVKAALRALRRDGGKLGDGTEAKLGLPWVRI